MWGRNSIGVYYVPHLARMCLTKCFISTKLKQFHHLRLDAVYPGGNAAQHSIYTAAIGKHCVAL